MVMLSKICFVILFNVSVDFRNFAPFKRDTVLKRAGAQCITKNLRLLVGLGCNSSGRLDGRKSHLPITWFPKPFTLDLFFKNTFTDFHRQTINSLTTRKDCVTFALFL